MIRSSVSKSERLAKLASKSESLIKLADDRSFSDLAEIADYVVSSSAYDEAAAEVGYASEREGFLAGYSVGKKRSKLWEVELQEGAGPISFFFIGTYRQVHCRIHRLQATWV